MNRLAPTTRRHPSRKQRDYLKDLTRRVGRERARVLGEMLFGFDPLDPSVQRFLDSTQAHEFINELEDALGL